MLAILLDKHCREHPNTPYSVAVNLMITELAPDRLNRSSDYIAAENSGYKVVIYREVLIAVQRKLKAKGFYSGRLDGSFNKITRKSLMDYQESANIRQTGVPDQTTLYDLFYRQQMK